MDLKRTNGLDARQTSKGAVIFFDSLLGPSSMVFGVHFRLSPSDLIPKIIRGPQEVKWTSCLSNFKRCRNFLGSLLGPSSMVFGIHFRLSPSDLIPKIIHGPQEVKWTSSLSNFKRCRNFLGLLLGPSSMVFGPILGCLPLT